MADPGNKKTDVIGKKIRDILADQSKINGIVDIIEELSSKDSAVVLECIDGSCKIFSELIQSGAFPITKVSKIAKKKSKIPEKPELIFEAWLRHNYALTVNKLLALLRHSSPKIMEKVVETLMIFVKAENLKLQQRSTVLIFSNDLFLRIVKQLTNGLHSNTLAAKLLKPYYQYNDISYYMLRNVGKIVSTFLDEMPTKCGPHFAENVYHLLQSTVIPECQDDVPGNLFAISTETMEGNELSGNHTIMNLNSYKKAFTSAWMSFLSLQLDKNLYRRVMVMLDERVVPYLVDPKILMDFLMDSYDIGGMISILALNSLFVLIHKYNLDYPNFYQKLYCLFNEEIFHLKYRARFFYLADLFLMSTHLPAYLVAAFIKRLSRLALSAPPHGVALIVTFVSNLLKRHPNCNVLIHRKMRKQEKVWHVSTSALILHACKRRDYNVCEVKCVCIAVCSFRN